VKIGFPVEANFFGTHFYVFGHIAEGKAEDVYASIQTESGIKIVGQPVSTFYPYDWGFFFDCVPQYLSLKLVVVALDGDGNKSKDVTHVLGLPNPAAAMAGVVPVHPPAGQVNISFPPAAPSPYSVKHSFSTWGTVTGVNPAGMTATLSQGGVVVANGVANQHPPPTMQWQFDFGVPVNITGNATLQVNCNNANPGNRTVSIS
jgi:hypothetical protein